MASVNRKTHVETTHEGAAAASISYKRQLQRSVLSCMLWEDGFYENGQDIARRISSLCGMVTVQDIAEIAVQAKTHMRLRHVPLLLVREILRRKEGRSLMADLLPSMITRPDDMQELLAMYWRDNKDEPLAKQLKIHLGEQFRKFSEYQLAKYNGGNKAIKLRDVIRMVRPKPRDAQQSELWARLVKNQLATPDTWETAISATQDKKATWTRLLVENKLGGLAMLRNLRNMREAHVDKQLIRDGIAGIDAGRLLPMNFIAAARHNVELEPEIERKFMQCFANRVKNADDTIVMIDISGSMDEKLSSKSELRRVDVACALAMIAREMFENCRFFSFSNHEVEVPARHGFALRDAILQSQGHNGTRLGASVANVIAKHACSRLIVISDEQSQDRVPDHAGYMINVASNRHGVGYGAWTHIDGWSDKVLDYIMEYESQKQQAM